jgi:diguanylate cyclase (GGDEF)-like protein
MRRKYSYALTAGMLCSGTPDVMGIRLARTALFAAFGYILGRQADELAELSQTDPLTRLLNARGFAARLHAEIKRSQRYDEPLSLLFLYVDGLKNINDRHGHRAGSDALRHVADVIRGALRETDMSARWGGDEFTILVPRTGMDAAVHLADRIRTRLAEQSGGWPVTASIGVATLGSDEDGVASNAAALMRAADDAMYEAKRRGKNTVVAADTNGAAEAAPLCLA